MKNVPLFTPPTVNSSLSYGWEKMKQYFLPLLLVVVVIAVVNAPFDTMEDVLKDNGDALLRKDKILLQILAAAYWLLLLPAFEYGADLMFIQAVRNQELDFKDLLAGFRNYLNVVLAHLLVTALVGIALIALILPGIFVACRLVFVSYLVIDKGMEPIEAVETSWKMTKNHYWKVLALALTSLLIGLGGLLLLVVGLIPALIWIKASFASLYEAILVEYEGEKVP